MVKSPAHFEQPDTSKGRAATQERDLKPAKSDFKVSVANPHAQAKREGSGFSGNSLWSKVYSDNPAAQPYRNPPQHKY
jgi:hypothetical protein